jgi:hypothetical protein
MVFMRKRVANLLAVAAVALSPHLLSHAQGAAADVPIQVEMANVEAPAAFAVLARGMGVPLIVGPFLKQRISLSGTYRSSRDVIEKMAGEVGAVVSQQGAILIVRPACLSAIAPPTKRLKDEKPTSLYFQDIGLKTLLSLLEVSLPEELQLVEDLRRQNIAATLKDMPRRDVVAAIAFASGMAIVPAEDGREKLVRLPTSPVCRSVESSGHAAGKWPAPTTPRANNCPYRVQRLAEEGIRKCGPLEFFSLQTLFPRGFVRVNDRYLALIESPDGVLTAARIGDYLGQDHGRINGISPEGILVREFIRDSRNEYQDSSRTLRFGVRPLPPPFSVQDHVEEGSAQHRYAASLGTLFAASRVAVEFADVCMRQFPSDAASVEVAVSTWRAQNAKALAEIDRHAFAYMERQAQDLGEPTDVFENRYRREVSEGTSRLVKQVGGASSEAMNQQCQSYPSTLKGVDHDLERRYADELEVIRKCSASATCPNLR